MMGDEKKSTAKGSSRTVLIGLLFIASVLVALASIIFSVGTERIKMESISMQPTLFPGDYMIVNKLAYRFDHSPDRGDVIVFRYPPNPSVVPYIKRIIGIPGDQVHIADGKVYINGQPVLETWLIEPTKRGGDWSVPSGQYFVLGDNRNNSSDSRSWGFVPLANILGRVELIYLPPQHWTFLH